MNIVFIDVQHITEKNIEVWVSKVHVLVQIIVSAFMYYDKMFNFSS